jgi:hypothetical protein
MIATSADASSDPKTSRFSRMVEGSGIHRRVQAPLLEPTDSPRQVSSRVGEWSRHSDSNRGAAVYELEVSAGLSARRVRSATSDS